MKGDKYICIEHFFVTVSHYNIIHGIIEINIGDVYEVLKEPNEKKKLFKLKRENDKFETIIYIRKSALNRYFKFME